MPLITHTLNEDDSVEEPEFLETPEEEVEETPEEDSEEEVEEEDSEEEVEEEDSEEEDSTDEDEDSEETDEDEESEDEVEEEDSEEEPEGDGVVYEDELTPAAEVMAAFLTHADFSEFFEHEDLYLHTAQGVEEVEEGSDEEPESYEYLPGAMVAQYLDEEDAVNMFLTFADAYIPEEGLEATVQRAAIADLLGEKKGPFKRGSFKKIIKAKGKAGKAAVMRMMLAMLNKGVIKRKKGNPSEYQRDKGYKTGGVGAKKKGVERHKAKKKAQIKRTAKKTKKVFKGAGTSVESEQEDFPVFGDAIPVEDGDEVHFFQLAMDEGKKGKCDKCGKPAFACKCKDDDKDDDDKDEGVQEGLQRNGLGLHGLTAALTEGLTAIDPAAR